ncbi:ABC-F family ATP-binding cassette domain-containing protein [Photobacterium sp. TY1-4]|uniref:ABC-F family ATP-binding cassette domain-containing protein n=1 Tax=Photobacterium sp. TY1-4 TaxID=2899122 RepID=UPI0021C1EFEB|nr:ABC-F family ATP-binding cassette domain-containing protein [Photobacterium sp. TY1-4]UXI03174.1 ATP-binding cassette domain-containing protein [Photobacterium sp. TY1-4]
MAMSASIMTAHALAVYHHNGEALFSGVSFSLEHQITGLVGKNGAGKSVLAGILSQQIQPDAGTVRSSANIGCLAQLTNITQRREMGSVAAFLGLETKLQALARIEHGSCAPEDFELVGDDWEIREVLRARLSAIGLPPDPFQPCQALSGGELIRLQLWQLFEGDYDFLILDEPSNHLDQAGRCWLIQQLHQYCGGVLLISHDRQLLREVDRILELTAEGMCQYGGNYTDYVEEKARQQGAASRALASAENQVTQLRRQHQRSQEKAQQRAVTGKKERRSGSQPKMLLDGKREGAQLSASARKVQFSRQLAAAEQRVSEHKARYVQDKPLQLKVNAAEKRLSAVLDVTQLTLRYGQHAPISFRLTFGDRVHLTGPNGCGKSTLLKTLLGELQPTAGEAHCRASLCYLDQHFSLLDEAQTVLANLQRLCPDYTETELRTMAAGVGFRRQRAELPVGRLSGGERMKVALLVISHQPGETLLLLDEPDNHLDLVAKQMLARALHDHQGPMILVSHDPDFVADVGVQDCLALEPLEKVSP